MSKLGDKIARGEPLVGTIQEMFEYLIEWAKTLSPEEKAKLRAEMAKQFEEKPQ